MPQVKFVKFCHVSNGLASQVNIGGGIPMMTRFSLQTYERASH